MAGRPASDDGPDQDEPDDSSLPRQGRPSSSFATRPDGTGKYATGGRDRPDSG
jgi:hypothetical protein